MSRWAGSAPVYFHRDNQPVPSAVPFYYVSFGPSAPSWIAGDDWELGLIGGDGVHGRVESLIGPEYERLAGRGRRVRVGTIYWDADRNWEVELRDPRDVHASRGMTYDQELAAYRGGR